MYIMLTNQCIVTTRSVVRLFDGSIVTTADSRPDWPMDWPIKPHSHTPWSRELSYGADHRPLWLQLPQRVDVSLLSPSGTYIYSARLPRP